MRQAFSENYPEITPQFSEIGSLEDAEKFAIEYGYPVMLKPANLAKSLLISRCNDKNDLAKHYQYMQEQIGNLYAIKVKSKQPKILIEQYLEGSLFSVDLLTNEQGDVTSFDPVELIFAKDIGIDDNHNFARFLPMSSGQEKARELKLTAAKAARAIGLTNSPAHVELIVTKNGIFVIEIGARWGGYRPQMHLLAQGLDLIELELSVLNGGEIDTATSIANHVAVIELFSNTTGIYKGITGIEQVKDLRSYYSMINHSKLGTLIGLAKYGYSPVASILLSSKDKEQLDKDYTFIKDNLVVEVV
jgi:biotin carboxylase